MDGAAGRGHLQVVEWLHDNRSEGCTTRAQDDTHSMEVLKWLLGHRSEECTVSMMAAAASRGDFEMLMYLVGKEIAQDSFPHALERAG